MCCVEEVHISPRIPHRILNLSIACKMVSYSSGGPVHIPRKGFRSPSFADFFLFDTVTVISVLSIRFSFSSGSINPLWYLARIVCDI